MKSRSIEDILEDLTLIMPILKPVHKQILSKYRQDVNLLSSKKIELENQFNNNMILQQKILIEITSIRVEIQNIQQSLSDLKN